ncbi:MAG: protein arginine kinase activator [Thermosediminibacterales bacterium]|nr:protein arginine kinase activator [Thermosediminibacterales bacterium]MDK2836386.1 protein arginine kinase activator [Thermosediminibacterales bacterium]
MLCTNCKKRPATVHYTKIVNGEKTEMHLCQVCAKEISDFQFNFEPNFSIHNLLAGLLNSMAEPTVGIDYQRNEHCPSCGMSFNEFSQIGRFGCNECYSAFEGRIEPILKRIHGSSVHTGKVPRRAGGELKVKREIDLLKAELDRVVKLEEYEKAAEIRDKIRELEKQLDKNK